MAESSKPEAADICHIEIPAADLAKAKAFYSSMFGWKIQQNTPSEGYWFFKAGNAQGAFDSSRKTSDDGVCLIVEVSDIPSTLRAIGEHGGKALSEKTELPDGLGYVACFRDPNGVKMELWSES